MNQMFLTELGIKTHRGLVARVKAGRSRGGKCYGYNIARGQHDERGLLTVEPDQAEAIRRIFRDYASGKSPRPIAYALNSEGVPGPRGGEWAPTTIYGDRRSRDGILCQELYIGVRVYNRRTFKKHPDTGKRSGRLNPVPERFREPVPELRLIDDNLWAAVQNRQKSVSDAPAAHARKPKRLLSGLMTCSLCDSGMTMNGQKFACSAARERGTFINTKIIAAATVERRVLAGVEMYLISPEAIALAVTRYQEAAQERWRMIERERVPMEKELVEICRRLERAPLIFVEELIDLYTLKARLAPMNMRR